MRYSRGFEDYLEAIYVLSRKKKPVRTKDVAEMLSVKLPSVTEVVQKLALENLVQHLPYGEIVLTDKGKKVGKATWKKHRLILKFLIEILGVDESTAFNEACLIEHSLSRKTLSKLENLVRNNKKQ